MRRLDPPSSLALALGLALSVLAGSAHAQLSGPGGFLYRVPLAQASAAAAPGLQVSPQSLSFADQVVGGSNASAILLANSGSAPLTVNAITYDGDASFTLDSSLCSSTLAAGQNCAIGVSFAPLSRGAHSGSILIQTDAGEGSITLSGRGLQGELQANRSSIPFGAALVGERADQGLEISNTGDALVSSIGYTANAPFAVEGDCAVIAPGESCALTLHFQPSAAGPASGSLAVTSPVGSLSVELSGASTAAVSVAAVVSGSPANFGSVAQNSPAVTRTVTLQNDGNVAMTLTGVTGLPAGVSVSSNTCSSVAPAATCSITLTMGTAAATSFTNHTSSTAGATTNTSILVSGAVTANYAANQFSSATRQRTAYVCPDHGYCMSFLVSNIYAIRNNTGQSLTVQSARLCGANELTPGASNFRYFYHPSSAQGTGTTTTSLGTCADTPVSISWPNGTFIHLVHEADYNTYGSTNWPRPQRFGISGTETTLAGTGTFSTGSAQVVLSNGQRLTLTASGLTLN